MRDALGRHDHARARLGVAAGAAVTPADPEGAESPELDLVATLTGVDDRREHGRRDDLGVLASEVGTPGDGVDQLGLGHAGRILLLLAVPRRLRGPEGVAEGGGRGRLGGGGALAVCFESLLML